MANPNNEVMRKLVTQGKAMPPQPGSDSAGRFNIENRADLDKAIRAVGRVRPNDDATRAKVRRFIMQRAKALNATDMIPDTWQADGSLKTGAAS